MSIYSGMGTNVHFPNILCPGRLGEPLWRPLEARSDRFKELLVRIGLPGEADWQGRGGEALNLRSRRLLLVAMPLFLVVLLVPSSHAGSY